MQSKRPSSPYTAPGPPARVLVLPRTHKCGIAPGACVLRRVLGNPLGAHDPLFAQVLHTNPSFAQTLHSLPRSHSQSEVDQMTEFFVRLTGTRDGWTSLAKNFLTWDSTDWKPNLTA